MQENLQSELSSDINFTAYRITLKAAQKPMLPALGVIVADIVSVESHVRDRLDDGAVDWNRRSQLAEHYKEFVAMQQACAFTTLKKDNVMCRNLLNSMDEMQTLPSSLLRVSLMLEPKDGVIEGYTTKRSFAKTFKKFETMMRR